MTTIKTYLTIAHNHAVEYELTIAVIPVNYLFQLFFSSGRFVYIETFRRWTVRRISENNSITSKGDRQGMRSVLLTSLTGRPSKFSSFDDIRSSSLDLLQSHLLRGSRNYLANINQAASFHDRQIHRRISIFERELIDSENIKIKCLIICMRKIRLRQDLLLVLLHDNP